jgi:hypothetical protein
MTCKTTKSSNSSRAAFAAAKLARCVVMLLSASTDGH